MISWLSRLQSRRYHRWTAVVAALILGVIALTGIAIQIEILIDDGSAPALGVAPKFPRTSDGTIATLPVTNEDIVALMANALQAVDAHAPGTNVLAAQLRLVGSRPIAEIVVIQPGNSPGAMPQQLFFEADTKKVAMRPTLIRKVHYYLLGLHRGSLIGPTGSALGIAGGIALLLLAVTGLAVYWHAWHARAQSGRRSLFWR